jgi:hypothetical protein
MTFLLRALGFGLFRKAIMNFLLRLVGLGFLIFGIYIAKASIPAISILAILGVLMFLPRSVRIWGWMSFTVCIVLIFLSGRAFIDPMNLWKCLPSFISAAMGYKMMTTGRSPF